MQKQSIFEVFEECKLYILTSTVKFYFMKHMQYTKAENSAINEQKIKHTQSHLRKLINKYNILHSFILYCDNAFICNSNIG